jgi:hypothetical protein
MLPGHQILKKGGGGIRVQTIADVLYRYNSSVHVSVTLFN